MIYRPSHFQAFELVDPTTFLKFGEDSVAFFRPELLIALDIIRELSGKAITVNNWKTGGPFKWRGLRTENCKEGAPYSMHRFGGAADFDMAQTSADDARKWIRMQRAAHTPLQAITRMEVGTSWVHIDTKPTDHAGLLEFRP